MTSGDATAGMPPCPIRAGVGEQLPGAGIGEDPHSLDDADASDGFIDRDSRDLGMAGRSPARRDRGFRE